MMAIFLNGADIVVERGEVGVGIGVLGNKLAFQLIHESR
jgi:hypothetical protein